MASKKTPDRPPAKDGDAAPVVRWDDSAMRTAHANVCNVLGTREEIVILFGVNQTWTSPAKELVVQLAERVILNPFTAKRLNLLLSRVIKEYETRYGPLPIEPSGPPRDSDPQPAT